MPDTSSPANWSASGQDAVAAAHQALLKNKNLQFDFPDYQNSPSPSWLQAFVKYLESLGPYFKYGSWALVGCAALVAGYFLVRFLMRRDWSRRDPPAKPANAWQAWQPSAEQARLLLRDADALAERGQFDEAVHLLLLVSIQEVGDRRPGLVVPALTSREIGRLPELSPRARSVFSEIAQVVECGFFGGKNVNAQDFAQCRRAFEQFTFPELWRDAA